jgi:hypothetical protein
MIVTRTEVCKCDLCGHEWLPKHSTEDGDYPLQCPNTKCKTRHWNDGGTYEHSRAS